jgi:hypothetical protein
MMMTIEQTVEIPADHRLTIEVPPEVPAKTGRPAEPKLSERFAGAFEKLKAEASQKAAERFAEMEKTGVDPLARFAGCLKDVFIEDGVEYQRRMRDEWPD